MRGGTLLLIFPLLAWWLTRKPATWKFATACAVIVLGGIALRSAIWLHFDALDPNRAWFVEDIYYPTWNRLDGLVAGVALATLHVFRPQAWQRLRAYANVALLAGLAVMALAFWLFRDRVGLLGNSIGWPVLSLGLALLVFAGAGRDSVIGRWQVPGAAWLAAVSYSLYLVHKPVFHLVETAFGVQLEGKGFIAFVAYGIASLLVAAVLHYAVERPFLQLRGRVLRRKESALPTAASGAADLGKGEAERLNEALERGLPPTPT